MSKKKKLKPVSELEDEMFAAKEPYASQHESFDDFCIYVASGRDLLVNKINVSSQEKRQDAQEKWDAALNAAKAGKTKWRVYRFAGPLMPECWQAVIDATRNWCAFGNTVAAVTLHCHERGRKKPHFSILYYADGNVLDPDGEGLSDYIEDLYLAGILRGPAE